VTAGRLFRLNGAADGRGRAAGPRPGHRHAPDNRDERPHSKGTQVTMDDDLIIWLTKDLSADNSIPHLTAADEDARRKLLVSHLI